MREVAAHNDGDGKWRAKQHKRLGGPAGADPAPRAGPRDPLLEVTWCHMGPPFCHWLLFTPFFFLPTQSTKACGPRPLREVATFGRKAEICMFILLDSLLRKPGGYVLDSRIELEVQRTVD